MTDHGIMIPRPNRLLSRLSRLYLRLAVPVYRWRVSRPGMVSCDGLVLATLPDVFHPVVMRAGTMLGKAAATLGPPSAPDKAKALDMGCGSGIVGAYLARNGYNTVCVDISPDAVRLTRANAILNTLEQRMDVREGDLFSPVTDEKFDVICFSPPYYKSRPTSDYVKQAFWAEDILERFAKDLPRFLKPDGVALVHLSTSGESEGFLKPAQDAGLAISVHCRKSYSNEIMTVYALRPAQPEGQS